MQVVINKGNQNRNVTQQRWGPADFAGYLGVAGKPSTWPPAVLLTPLDTGVRREVGNTHGSLNSPLSITANSAQQEWRLWLLDSVNEIHQVCPRSPGQGLKQS